MQRSRGQRGLAAALALAAVVVLGFAGWTLTARKGPPPTPTPASVHTAPPPVSATSRAITARAPSLPVSAPVWISVPAIGVSAPVMTVGTVDGSVGTPPLGAHNLAGWWKGSVTPGQPGPALIDGHVNGYGQVSVFSRLADLRAGDTISVRRADGRTIRYRVTWVQIVTKTAFPWNAVLGWTPAPTLRLVSCGGPFDAGTGHYLDNIIVYASEVVDL